MDLTSVRKSYRFYAPIYDYIFGRIVNEGRRKAVACFPQRPGDRILEIGVGTGLSLGYYKPEIEVVGIDVSPEMLRRARQRIDQKGHRHVRQLLEMDAEKLEFPDNSFHGAVAMYVASVVPDPEAMMREMFRVCRPGSPVVVLNHFASNRRSLQKMERYFARFSSRLGFKPDFCLNHFVQVTGRQPQSVHPVNFGGYWKLLEFQVDESSAGGAGAAEAAAQAAAALAANEAGGDQGPSAPSAANAV